MEAHCYRFLYSIDEGAYGAVYACLSSTGAVVAVKRSKYWDDPQCKRMLLREIRVLRALPKHPCTVSLVDAFRSKASGRPHLVFELLERSLHQELDGVAGRRMEADSLKVIAYQLVLGLAHCHQHKVIHRDIKPANVLLSGHGCHTVAKLCDFGFARFVEGAAPDAHEPMSSYVVTRWYRAPEVLARDEYGTPSDIWSLGCTLAEAATGLPLFPGCSSINQVARIMRCFGPLPPRQVRCLQADRELAVLAQPLPRSRTLAERLQGVDPRLLDVISACLALDPLRRPSANCVLQMPYFHDIPRLLSTSPFRGLLQQQPQQHKEQQQRGEERRQQGGGQANPTVPGPQHSDSKDRTAAATLPAHAAKRALTGVRQSERPGTAVRDPLCTAPEMHMRSAHMGPGQARSRASVDVPSLSRRADAAAAREQLQPSRTGSCGEGGHAVAPNAAADGVAAAETATVRVSSLTQRGQATAREHPAASTSQSQKLDSAALSAVVNTDGSSLPPAHMQSNLSEPPPMRRSTDLSMSGVEGLSAPAAIAASTLGRGPSAGTSSSGAGVKVPRLQLARRSSCQENPRPLSASTARRAAEQLIQRQASAASLPRASRYACSQGGAAAGSSGNDLKQQPSAPGDAAAVGVSRTLRAPQLQGVPPAEAPTRRAASSTALGPALLKGSLQGSFKRAVSVDHQATCSSGDMESCAGVGQRGADAAPQSADLRSVAQSLASSARDSNCSLPLDIALTSPMGLPDQQQHLGPRDKLPHCRGRAARVSSSHLFDTGPVNALHHSPARLLTGSLMGTSMADWGLSTARGMTHGSLERLPSQGHGQSPLRSQTALDAPGEDAGSAATLHGPKSFLSGTVALSTSAPGPSYMSARASWHRATTGLSRFALGSCDMQQDTSNKGVSEQAPPSDGKEATLLGKPASPSAVCLRSRSGELQAAGVAASLVPPAAAAAARDPAKGSTESGSGAGTAARAGDLTNAVQRRGGETSKQGRRDRVCSGKGVESGAGKPLAKRGILAALLSIFVCGASKES